MTWPVDQEREWGLFIASIADAEHGFFLLVYDRRFTYEALYRRLKSDFQERQWQWIKTSPSDRLVSYLESRLAGQPVKAVVLQLDAGSDSQRLSALNPLREQLYALPANIVIMAHQEAYQRLLSSAHDLITWINLPYRFQMIETELPYLPRPTTHLATPELEQQIDYYRDQVVQAVEQGDEAQAFQLLPPLAELYSDAQQYRTAASLYQALMDYHQAGANDRELRRFHEKLDTATGWRILADLNRGRINAADRTLLQDLFERGTFAVLEQDETLMIADGSGRIEPLSMELFVRLGILSDLIPGDGDGRDRQVVEPELRLTDAEQAHTYAASRYGIGYNLLEVSWEIQADGSANLVRTIEVEAYATIDTLDTFILIPEEAPAGETRLIGFKGLESLSPDRNVTIADTISSVAEKDVIRHSALMAISPQLMPGERLTYQMVERLPAGLYAVNLTPAELESRQTPYDYSGWSINRPTRRLLLKVSFPPGAAPASYGVEVRYATTSGFPSERQQFEEQRRLKNPKLGAINDGRSCLQWSVNYPMTGLIYILRWQPQPAI